MRRLRLLGLAATLGVLAFTLSGCSWSEALKLGWPEPITPQGHDNLKLWIGCVIAALAVGVIVWGLIFWTAAFHRHKATDTDLPRQFGYNMPLELVLTVIPFLIIAVLFYFTVIVQERMLAKPEDPEVVVDVTAFQWNWKFGYRSVDFDNDAFTVPEKPVDEVEALEDQGHDPQARSYLHFNQVETVGTSDEIPVLVLPSHKRIKFVLASADVVHSFWVIDFLFKLDVMPDPEANNSKNEFQITEIEKEDAFVGRCAELCGTYHSMMNFEVRVVNPNIFKAYLQYRLDHPDATNAEAMAEVGLPPKATKTEPFETRRGQQAMTAQK